jgi:hypothetical protein
MGTGVVELLSRSIRGAFSKGWKDYCHYIEVCIASLFC